MMKHCLGVIWLLLAAPSFAQTVPELNELSPDQLPPAPVNDPAMDLSMGTIYSSGEPDRVVNGCTVLGRPDWLIAADADTHVARMVVNAMGRAAWKNEVVESGDCSCENRWPNWAKVIDEFYESYGGLDRSALNSIERAYRANMRQNARAARAICQEQGR